MNILLLCGLDGTGILFEPFLELMPDDIRVDSQLLIYKMNADSNQELNYQATLIESQVTKKFNKEPVIIIAESYSGLLAYQLLLRKQTNIEKVFFVACFLKQPSQFARLAKYAYFIKPKWTKYAGSSILKYALFNQFANDDLLILFKQAMSELESPKKLAMFVQRCNNIANLPTDFSVDTKLKLPCVYFQASQDNLVSPSNVATFSDVFLDCEVIKMNGSHFLLQTNPENVWKHLKQHLFRE